MMIGQLETWQMHWVIMKQHKNFGEDQNSFKMYGQTNINFSVLVM